MAIVLYEHPEVLQHVAPAQLASIPFLRLSNAEPWFIPTGLNDRTIGRWEDYGLDMRAQFFDNSAGVARSAQRIEKVGRALGDQVDSSLLDDPAFMLNYSHRFVRRLEFLHDRMAVLFSNARFRDHSKPQPDGSPGLIILMSQGPGLDSLVSAARAADWPISLADG